MKFTATIEMDETAIGRSERISEILMARVEPREFLKIYFKEEIEMISRTFDKDAKVEVRMT